MRISGLGGSSRGICGGPWSALGTVYTTRGRQQRLGQNSWTHEKHGCLHGYVVVFQLLSCVWLFATPWTAARQASLSFTLSWSLLKLMSIELVMPSNHFILCRLLLLTSIFPRSGSFSMSQVFASGGQSIGVSASTSVLPMNTQHWSPLGWTGWISLQSKGLSMVFSNTTVQKHQFFSAQLTRHTSC